MAFSAQRRWAAKDDGHHPDIRITDYKPEYQPAFKKFNEEWIRTYFVMEEADYISLENPEKHILEKGGQIKIALLNGMPAGACALVKTEMPGYDYELSKMAVSPEARGLGLGWLLGKAITDAAKELGARSIFLESNTRLKPAISLYRKLGFKEVTGLPKQYERVDIHMELVFEP